MGKNPYLQEENDSTKEQERPVAPERKEKSVRKVWYCIVSVVLALVCFGAGFLVRSLTLGEGVRTLLKIKQAIDDNYYEDISDEEFYKAIYKAVNTELLDDYSEYMTADEYATATAEGEGRRSGLGLVFSVADAEGKPQLLVVRVCGNSPAEEKGFAEGDYILGFGASETQIEDSVQFDEFSAFLESYEEGETLFVKVKTGDEVRVVSIAKSVYVENYVFYRTNTSAYRFSGEQANAFVEGGEPLACLANDTAYLRLTQFSGKAADEFETAMERFKTDGKKNLVLDLRGNGGGYLDILEEIASYFCKNSDDGAPLAVVADYGDDGTEYYYAADNLYDEYFSDDSRICVLADASTASASEALMGCMLDYGAISYGDICLSERNGIAKTFGKGIMQTTFPFGLFNTDAIKLTTARLRWPVSYQCIHGRGIVAADGTLTTVENYGCDAEITAAIEKLFA